MEPFQGDLDALKGEIDAQRPLDDAIVRRVGQELLGEQVFSSNSIEGNTYTLRKTQAVLSTGQIVDVGRLREGQEVLNLGKAIEFVQELVQSHASIASEAAFTFSLPESISLPTRIPTTGSMVYMLVCL